MTLMRFDDDDGINYVRHNISMYSIMILLLRGEQV